MPDADGRAILQLVTPVRPAAMLRLAGGEARILGAAEAWIVRAGVVDCFAQHLALTEGEPSEGRRHHVLRAGPGGVVLALPARAALRLIAVGSQDAAVTIMPRDDLLRDPALAEALAAWCAALAGAVPDADPPEPPLAFDALAAFHLRVAAGLEDLVGRDRAAATARAAAQRGADDLALAAGLAQLASTRPGASPPGVPGVPGEDPCVAACRLAARACGLTLPFATPAPVTAETGDGAADGVETVIERVERIAGGARLRCRRVLLEGAWWQGARGVLIAVAREARTPVVLRPRPGGGYDRLDSRTGEAAARVTATAAASFGLEALQCYPALPDAAATPGRLLAVAARGIGPDARTFLATAVATGFLALAPPLAVALLFENLIPHAETGHVAELAGGLVLLALGALCFELAKAAALIRLEGRLALAIGAALTDRLLRLPVRFFAASAAGDLADRLRGVDEIRRTLTGTTVVTLLAGVFSSLSLVLLMWIDVPLALACAGLLALAMAVALAFSVTALRWERAAMQARGRLEGFVVQMVIGIGKLRVAAAERRAMRVWSGHFAAMRAALDQAQAARTGLAVFTSMLPLAVLATLFGGAMWLGTGSGRVLSLGDFMVFSAALGNLLGAVLTLSVELAGVLRAVPLYERALPLLRAATESQSGLGRDTRLRGEIALVGVSFRYDPDKPWVLQDVSLRIEAGEMVAIVGPSGSGKSTILRLLLGFERPERGMVLLDGTPLDQLDIAAVRRAMGVVLQQSRLSPGNIFQNIVGHSGMDVAAAWDAARQAGLADDIAAMPMGLHTTVMENGQGLSGGQIQRLAIARALVARPRIVLFDEATSALDNRTQDIVSRSLAGVAATRVVIAHRLSTIAQADRIFVLERGRLVQSGGHAALLAAPGLFADLAARQML